MRVIKTVAAFMNSEGGTLGIGISDDGDVPGIQRISITRIDLDGYQNWMITMLNNGGAAWQVWSISGLMPITTLSFVCRCQRVRNRYLQLIKVPIYFLLGLATPRMCWLAGYRYTSKEIRVALKITRKAIGCARKRQNAQR